METNKDIRNELFKRQELALEIEGDKNPGFAEVRKQIAEKFGKPEGNIDLLRVKGNFGNSRFNVEAYIYDSKEDLDSMQKLKMTSKQRKEEVKVEEGGSEEKPAEESAEAPLEAPAEEKPADDSSASDDTTVEEEKAPEEAEKPAEEVSEGKVEDKSEGSEGGEVPVEERPEEEKKAEKEEQKGEEENKAN